MLKTTFLRDVSVNLVNVQFKQKSMWLFCAILWQVSLSTYCQLFYARARGADFLTVTSLMGTTFIATPSAHFASTTCGLYGHLSKTVKNRRVSWPGYKNKESTRRRPGACSGDDRGAHAREITVTLTSNNSSSEKQCITFFNSLSL